DGASASEAQKKGLQAKPLPTLRRRENQALLQALKFKREERLPSMEALQGAFGTANSNNGSLRATAGAAAATAGATAAAVKTSFRSAVAKLSLPLVIGAAGILLCVILAAWWLLRSPARAQHNARAAAAT